MLEEQKNILFKITTSLEQFNTVKNSDQRLSFNVAYETYPWKYLGYFTESRALLSRVADCS